MIVIAFSEIIQKTNFIQWENGSYSDEFNNLLSCFLGKTIKIIFYTVLIYFMKEWSVLSDNMVNIKEIFLESA